MAAVSHTPLFARSEPARARLHGIGSADGGLWIGLSEADGISSEELLIGAANMQFVVADASSWPSYNLHARQLQGRTEPAHTRQTQLRIGSLPRTVS
jgi:hypothetical protein